MCDLHPGGEVNTTPAWDPQGADWDPQGAGAESPVGRWDPRARTGTPRAPGAESLMRGRDQPPAPYPRIAFQKTRRPSRTR
jgi:hypothetical protein